MLDGVSHYGVCCPRFGGQVRLGYDLDQWWWWWGAIHKIYASMVSQVVRLRVSYNFGRDHVLTRQ